MWGLSIDLPWIRASGGPLPDRRGCDTCLSRKYGIPQIARHLINLQLTGDVWEVKFSWVSISRSSRPFEVIRLTTTSLPSTVS